MTASLRSRVLRMERYERPSLAEWEALPRDLAREHLDLLLKKEVYLAVGRPIDEIDRRRAELPPLPPVSHEFEPPGDSSGRVTRFLREHAETNPEYRRLLAMLEDAANPESLSAR